MTSRTMMDGKPNAAVVSASPRRNVSGDPVIKLESIAATLSTPQQPAAEVVDRARLVPFITHWNNGEASFIADWSDFWVALDLDRPVLDLVEAAEREAERSEFGAFEPALRILLEPVVLLTFQEGLAKMCSAWARTAAGDQETELKNIFYAEWRKSLIRVPVPFSSADDWIAWILIQMERPLFPRPDGLPIMSKKEEEPLLRKILTGHIDVARQNGWVKPSPAH